jgi:uncharacterized membrane-anchored protein YhcB (DUF1043 family)
MNTFKEPGAGGQPEQRKSVEEILSETGLDGFPITCMMTELEGFGLDEATRAALFRKLFREKREAYGGVPLESETDSASHLDRVKAHFARAKDLYPQLATWYRETAQKMWGDYQAEVMMLKTKEDLTRDRALEQWERKDLAEVVGKLAARGYSEVQIVQLVKEALQKGKK